MKLFSVKLNQDDEEFIYSLAEGLVGSCQKGKFRREILVSNIIHRMEDLKLKKLDDYLEYVSKSDKEFSHFISALTIHTTQWFREKAHYDFFKKELPKMIERGKIKKFRIWSAACSTGEEIYSFGMILESYRATHPNFEYELFASDIDPVSADKARTGIYKLSAKAEIPTELHGYAQDKPPHHPDCFRVHNEIRKRAKFFSHSLLDPLSENEKFHFVVCRNVLIYFEANKIKDIIRNLTKQIHDFGMLCLGHSETIEAENFDLVSISNSIYQKPSSSPGAADTQAHNILIIDDSPTICKRLAQIITGPKFNTFTALDTKEAERIMKERPIHLITLDMHLGEEHGGTWLKSIRSKGMRLPVIVVTDASIEEVPDVLGALENGAQDFFNKASLSQNPSLLVETIDSLIIANEKKPTQIAKVVRNKPLNQVKIEPELIVIGASTGGTEALTKLLTRFQRDTPPVLVVQHIFPSFAKPFAERLAQFANLTLGDCQSGQDLKNGHIYVAYTDQHISVQKKLGKLKLLLSNSSPMTGHKPSVDFLFHSVADLKIPCLGVLLTGMGKDGARGLLALKETGSVTFAQNEESCVVFGMPGEAIKLNAADFVGDLREIRSNMDSILLRPRKAAS